MKMANERGLTLPAALGIVGVLIIIAVIGWLLFGPSQEAAAPTSSNQSADQPTDSNETNDADQNEAAAATVTYTNDGFSPETITVKQGETVVFVNNSTRDFWPASNDHPVHTIYPEFDARDEIGPGGSYSFTFDQAGTWGYHNHKLEGHGGTVVVEPN